VNALHWRIIPYTSTMPTMSEQAQHPSSKRLNLAFLMLMLVSTLTMIAFDRPLVRGDGLAYLVWIDTIVLDQDVNLNNQHDRFREVNTYQIEWSFERERWVNIFPFGIAFLQAPFYLTGHAFRQADILNPNPDYFRGMQGIDGAYSIWLMIGANVMLLVAIGLAWHVGRRFLDNWTAAVVVYTVFLGTPIFYYSTISPVNSHNAGAFAAAAYVYLLMICTGAFRPDDDEHTEPKWWVWALLGVFAALTVLARWQLLMVVAPGYVLLLWQRNWRGFVIATIAAGIAMLPLPLIWNAMFGAPFVVPFDTVNDEQFMGSGGNAALNVLVETIRHSPIVLLSLVGLPILWGKNRVWGLLFGAMIALQLLVNGAALDWNAGESYGMRRMSELYIVYAILACVTVGWMVERLRDWRYSRVVVRVALTLLIAYTFLYIFAFLDFTWTNPAGAFSDHPDVMIRYFIKQPDRHWILWEVYRTHVGPLAWSMPGP